MINWNNRAIQGRATEYNGFIIGHINKSVFEPKQGGWSGYWLYEVGERIEQLRISSKHSRQDNVFDYDFKLNSTSIWSDGGEGIPHLIFYTYI